MLPNKEEWRRVFSGKATFGATLLVGVIDFYGTECFSWTPETLLVELEDDLDMEISSENFNKLRAAMELVISDDFYESASTFNFLCCSLNGTEITKYFELADSYDIAWGIVEALIIGAPDRTPIFSEEVVAFVSKVLQEDGILNPPSVILEAVLSMEDYDNSIEDFSDDPNMYQAMTEVSDGKTKEMSEFIQQNFALFVTQLEGLPLSSGDTKGYLKLFSEANV